MKTKLIQHKNRAPYVQFPRIKLEVKIGNNKHITRTMGPFRLYRNDAPRTIDEPILWVLSIKTSKTKYTEVGHFEVNCVIDKSKVSAVIASSQIFADGCKGVGLGKLVYQSLADIYGGLESDMWGNTSEEAARVWKALKAKKLPGKRFRIEAQR